MLVSSLFIQFLLPLFGVLGILAGMYFGVKFAYNTWDKMKRDAALRAKAVAEARKAEEAAENEQLRNMWAEGAQERLANYKALRKQTQQTGKQALSDDIDD